MPEEMRKVIIALSTIYTELPLIMLFENDLTISIDEQHYPYLLKTHQLSYQY